MIAAPLEVQRQYGDRAPVSIAERIGALVLAGDEAGVEAWRLIASKLEHLAQQPESTR